MLTLRVLFSTSTTAQLHGAANCTSVHSLLPSVEIIASSVEVLNARFANGKPSNRLHDAGVVMRGYDADSHMHPPGDPSWITHGPSPGVASVSVVNARQPYLFAGNTNLREQAVIGHAGVVISSHAAHSSLSCAYPGDASSIYVRCAGRPSEECTTGCVGIRLLPGATPSTLQRQGWCSSNGVAHESRTCDGSGCGGCAWRPDALAIAMALQENKSASMLSGCPTSRNPLCACIARGRTCCSYPTCPLYNELILDARSLEEYNGRNADEGPRAIEAVYFLERTAALSDASFAQSERAAHALQRALQPAKVSAQGCQQQGEVGQHPHQHTSPFVATAAHQSPILVAVDLSRERPFRLV